MTIARKVLEAIKCCTGKYHTVDVRCKVGTAGSSFTLDGWKDGKFLLAGFRPNSKIIGNFRKIENFYDHFIKRHK